MISKIKAATDLQIKGSMLLKRNKIFEFDYQVDQSALLFGFETD